MDWMADRRKSPCPDPDLFVWVNGKDGGFWRRKRGTVKKAVLNKAFALSSEHTKISSPAARRIVSKLRPYMTGLVPRMLTAAISGKLRKGLNETGKLSLAYLKDFDLQTDHPLPQLLLVSPKVVQQGDELVVSIPVTGITVKRHSKLVSDYFLELVLLWGDAGYEDGLKTDSETSGLFRIDAKRKGDCVLRMLLPKEDQWMALLKVSCMEGNEMALANRNYGMRVIAVGN